MRHTTLQDTFLLLSYGNPLTIDVRVHIGPAHTFDADNK